MINLEEKREAKVVKSTRGTKVPGNLSRLFVTLA